jgi:TRAP-type C4-dicarboxylate transport system permease small subunit
MRRVLSTIRDDFEKILSIILLVILVGVVLMQVATRYLGVPLSWTDEVSRVLLAWLTFVGASAVLKVDGHARATFIRDWFGAKAKIYFDLFADVCFALVALFGTYYGFALTAKIAPLTLASLDVSWAWWFASFPVGTSLMLLRIIEKNWSLIARTGSLDKDASLN